MIAHNLHGVILQQRCTEGYISVGLRVIQYELNYLLFFAFFLFKLAFYRFEA